MVMLRGSWFVSACAVVAAAILLGSRVASPPLWLLAAEVLATILGLFVFGSFRWQIHKNALTYGMLLVIGATFCGLPTSAWRTEIQERSWTFWLTQHLLSFQGLDGLIHADTMLFILGLTLFVSVIAQTRVLERVTFVLLRRYDGRILPTVIAVTAAVACASGVLDGVSMIGLTIRTLVIIMMLAAAPSAAIRYAVMVCTAVTTICGIWLAYGEPPNLIMKANLYPYLDNLFFLRHCAPAAVAAYLVVAWQLRGKIGRRRIDLDLIDIIDANAEDVRFLQASRHGNVLIPVELVEDFAGELGSRADAVLNRLRQGEPLGLALVHEDVEVGARRMLLGHYITDELADGLDRHYLYLAAGDEQSAFSGRTGRRRGSRFHGSGPQAGAEDRRLCACPVLRDAHRSRHQPRRAAVSGLVRRICRRTARHMVDSQDAPPGAARSGP